MREKLLLVIDYQKDFVDGTLGFPGAEGLDGAIASKIDAYHAAGADVVFTFDTHSSHYAHTQEGRKLPIPHCIEDTEGWRLYGETAKARRPDDLCFVKSTFPSLELADWLSMQNYAEVELVGLVSYICVLTNAVMVKSALPEAEVIVDASCTAGPDAGLHAKCLDVLEGIQVTVRNRT
ncbi:MAG: cysteine hydrolase [Oscillospiraceae bacterium]|nr:cysteine hydrolase [Oscillospiraceae bacterium]